MKNLPSPEAFCQYLWHEYLEKQNYAILGDCFVPETTVIGTGEHEVSRNLEQFVNKISAEIDARTTAFIIEDQWFQSQWISADSAGDRRAAGSGTNGESAGIYRPVPLYDPAARDEQRMESPACSSVRSGSRTRGG